MEPVAQAYVQAAVKRVVMHPLACPSDLTIASVLKSVPLLHAEDYDLGFAKCMSGALLVLDPSLLQPAALLCYCMSVQRKTHVFGLMDQQG
jgi:hypothetical protein